jgi:uncharacterized membrane protein YfcA
LTLALALTLIALGFVGAFISGFLGVGGAIVMIPLLLYVPPLLAVGSVDIKHAAGITMTQVLAASILGAWTHGRGAMVHRKLALVGGSAMALGALVGAVMSHVVSGRVLLAIFAVMTTVALPLMLVRPARWPGAAAAAEMPFKRASAMVYAAVIGIASGLVGAGGAFLLIPVLIAVLRIPVRVSIGTSLAMTGMSASMGFVGKALTAQIPLWPAVVVVLGSVAGAPLGARVSQQAPVNVLRTVLAALIALVMVRVWVDVFSR